MNDQTNAPKDKNKQGPKSKSKPVTKSSSDTSVNQSTAAPTPVQVAAPAKSGGKGLSIFAILLSLAALGGSGYNWYISQIQGKLDNADLAVGVAQIGGQITRLGDSLTSLQKQQETQQANSGTKEQLGNRLLQANSELDLKFRDIDQNQTALLGAVDKINQGLQSTGVDKMAVDEVSQLLKLANNSALFSADPDLAIKALKLADNQLKDLADPRYAKVRRSINQEVAKLEAVELVDMESVTVKLKALADRIPSLKLENDTPTIGKVVIDSDEQPQGFKANAKQVLSDLVDLVEVQRIDQAPKPLLVPEQRYFLDQNIQLQLSKAELAMLQQRKLVYTASLEAAALMLQDYFDTRDTSVKEVLSQIEQLKGQALASRLPDISGSYAALQAVRGGE